jgi:3-oxoacyl-[acyl-carrier-protein] synthase-3
MNSYYSEEELQNLNFKSIGNNNKISRNTKFYNTKNITIGNNCRIDDNCIISSSNKGIIFGDFVHLSNNVSISGNALIKLEDFSGLSSKVSIFGSTDDYSGKSMTNPCVGSFNECCTNITNGDIIIGKHAIVGCNSVILPGCSIASGVSIGALSLVNRKITKIGIYQGNPIEYIKDKDDNYLKLEEKYFSKYYNKTTNTIINDKNETKTNKNEILTKINNLLNIDITTKNNEKILNIGVDSLTFIQLQNIINKNYNITIDYNCTINDILEICDTKNKSTNSKLVNEINESKLVNQVNDLNSSITIIGLGHKLSSKEIKNDFYEKIVDTNHEWIKKRTGIERKFILDENEILEEIIIDSSLKAIQSANIKSTEIDLIILASSTPEDLFGDASKIAFKIGATNAFAFDIRNACNGFITSIITAEKFLKDEKKYKVALVIGADCLSRYVDWNDRKSNILFGDGAGCVILKKSQGKNNGILDNLLKTDGEYNSILNIYSKTEKSTINDINLLNNNYNKLTLDGIGVFNFVINFMPDSIEKFLSSNNINKNQIKYFVLHQANIRIIEEISNKLNVNKEKFVYNIDKVGNTSAASIPILLDDLYNNNKLEKDDLLLISSFGAGMSAGMILFKWSMEKKNLNNKVALVTGGTKGIGKELAIKLKNKGYITIVCSRNNNNNLQDIEHYKADISKLDDIKNLYEFIYKKYGRLDILINNAGVEGPENPFTITDIEDIQNCININLMGTILLTKNMINLLKDSKGIIINISSIAAGDNISNCFKRTIYSMTKSAIGTFTRGIAGELKNICNVYSINPPFVDTDLLDRVVNKFIAVDNRFKLQSVMREIDEDYGGFDNVLELYLPNDTSAQKNYKNKLNEFNNGIFSK